MHALTDIEHKMADQVGLILELLQVELVRATVDFPVDIAQIVPGRVFTMFRELD